MSSGEDNSDRHLQDTLAGKGTPHENGDNAFNTSISRASLSSAQDANGNASPNQQKTGVQEHEEPSTKKAAEAPSTKRNVIRKKGIARPVKRTGPSKIVKSKQSKTSVDRKARAEQRDLRGKQGNAILGPVRKGIGARTNKMRLKMQDGGVGMMEEADADADAEEEVE